MAASTAVWAAVGTYTVQAGSRADLSGSVLRINCNALDVQGTVAVGSGTVGPAGNLGIRSGGSLNGGTGLIDVGGHWSNAGTFTAGTGTVNLSGNCAAGPVTVSGNNAFCNLILGTGQQYVFDPPAPIGGTVVNCALNLGSGNTLTASGQVPLVIRLGPNATVTGSATLNNVIIGDLPQTPIPTLHHALLVALSLLLVLFAWAGMGGRLSTRRAPHRGR